MFLMKTVLKFLCVIAMLLLSRQGAAAFATSTYAESSRLASGRWVKVSVEQTGLHLISVADLRSWGFSDPSRVRVYGYGGARLPEQLTAANYVDDLPQVQTELIGRGIVFYAVGPDSRVNVDNTDWHYKSFNPYSTRGYYFLSDTGDERRPIPVEGQAPDGGSAVTTFVEGVHHEVDQTSPMQTGHTLVGEDFRFTNTRQFSFAMPGRVEGTPVWMQCDFFAAATQGTVLSFSTNSAPLPSVSTDRVKASAEDADTCRIRKVFTPTGESLTLTVKAVASGSVKVSALDHLAVCYSRALSLPAAGTLLFTIPAGSPVLAGAGQSTHVWDVTNPLDIAAMPLAPSGSGMGWGSSYAGARSYAAWNENATFHSVRIADTSVKPQDLHSQPVPDMVIVTHPDLRTQAERVAELRRSEGDGLSVLVVTPAQVYNEFSSGTPDAQAIRRMMKMYYDRGLAEGHTPRYLLLFGGVSYDHRGLTPEWSVSAATIVPTWQTDAATSDSYSYCSDDPFCYLEDNSGLLNGRDLMCLAVGRIPARSAAEAKVFVDRLVAYSTAPAAGEWRNRMVFLADDGDNGIHLTQTEDVVDRMRGCDSGDELTYRKVYLDAYPLQGGVTVAGRSKLHSLLADGVIWWNYIGHASTTALTGEGVFTLRDLSSLYLKRPAFFYGATCSFCAWDRPEEAGLQTLTLTDGGGLIGGISAVRPVLIARNGPFSSTFGSELFARDADGRFRTPAEVLRLAKNRTLTETNKMRYVMLGDPSMRLAIPENIVTLDSVNGMPVTPVDATDADPTVISAFSHVSMSGRVTGYDGQVLTDFDGYVSVTLYDAEMSFTTVRGDYDNPFVIDEQGERLFTARGPVRAGLWNIETVIPAEIADNYRPATVSLYAASAGEDKAAEACGVSRDLYVCGIADGDIADATPPVIEYLYLNHDTFRPGDTVNDTPMLLARVTDDTALNMAANGVGHQMSLRIDNTDNFTDISGSFVPDADGTPGGNIAYQLPAISTGAHRGVFKVWDVAGNSSTREFDFFVDPDVAPHIFDVYTDANPATDYANFYIRHNRPEAMLTVKIDIYDISGRAVWSSTGAGRADMYESSPVRWDLTDSSGRPVGRGIYIYRATVTTDAETSSSAVRRIAVAPR